MGHSTVAETLDTYASTDPLARAAAGRKISAIMTPADALVVNHQVHLAGSTTGVVGHTVGYIGTREGCVTEETDDDRLRARQAETLDARFVGYMGQGPLSRCPTWRAARIRAPEVARTLDHVSTTLVQALDAPEGRDAGDEAGREAMAFASPVLAAMVSPSVPSLSVSLVPSSLSAILHSRKTLCTTNVEIEPDNSQGCFLTRKVKPFLTILHKDEEELYALSVKADAKQAGRDTEAQR